MVEELEKLSDEEIVNIFNVALEVTKSENIDFNEAHKVALERFIESKKEENTVVTPGTIEVDEPVMDGPVGDIEYKKQSGDEYFLSSERLSEFSREIQSRKSEAIERADARLKSNGYNDFGYNYYFHELDGRVTNPDVYYGSMFTNINNVDRNALLTELKAINEANRESSYIFLKCLSDDAIEEEKKDTLKYYKDLLEKLENRDKFHLGETQSTLSFSDIQKINWDDRGIARCGGRIAVGYDDLFSTADSFVNYASTTDKTNDVRLYEEMVEAVRARLQGIESMSPSEYRDYRIGLMRLSEEEKEKFDLDILQFKSREQEQEQEVSPMVR